MKAALTTIAVSSFVLSISLSQALAAENGKSATTATKEVATKTEHVAHQAYLGIMIAPVYPGLVKHVPDNFREGQGVFVGGVTAGSPAEKAGIQPNDILMSYDDQKLFAPQQLVRLVRSDKANRQATMTVLRDGKTKQIKVTLGSHAMTATNTETGRMLEGQASTNPESHPREQAGTETFDSMILRNLGKGRFNVEIQYLGKDGKLEKHKFEGTKHEIRRSIVAEKDLPSAERRQLLHSLEMPYEGLGIPEGSRMPEPQAHRGESDRTF